MLKYAFELFKRSLKRERSVALWSCAVLGIILHFTYTFAASLWTQSGSYRGFLTVSFCFALCCLKKLQDWTADDLCSSQKAKHIREEIMWRTIEFGIWRWMQILIRWSYFIRSWFTQQLYFPVAEARGKNSRSVLAWYKALTNKPCPEKSIFSMGKSQDLSKGYSACEGDYHFTVCVSGLNFLHAPLIFAA